MHRTTLHGRSGWAAAKQDSAAPRLESRLQLAVAGREQELERPGQTENSHDSKSSGGPSRSCSE
jgi:hypothetical protein